SLVFGCTFRPERAGGDGGVAPPTVIDGLTAIRIAPTDASVVLDLAKSPPTQKFEAYGTINGHEEKITDRVAWTSERAIVTQTDRQGRATAGTTGGIVTLTARNGTIVGSTQLTVQLSGVFTADGAGAMPALPANPGSKFGGAADARRAPQLVYPN